MRAPQGGGHDALVDPRVGDAWRDARSAHHSGDGTEIRGILRSYSIDSPASLSIHEEVTIYALRPVMGVFNNLVMYDQRVKQNSMTSIVPDRRAASHSADWKSPSW